MNEIKLKNIGKISVLSIIMIYLLQDIVKGDKKSIELTSSCGENKSSENFCSTKQNDLIV